MKCEEFSEKLDEYIHGELDDAARAAMDAHISECESCRAEAELAEKICASLKNLPWIDVPPDFKAGVMDKIRTEKKGGFYKMWQPYAALAACVVLAVVLRTGVSDMLGSLKTGEIMPTPTPAATASSVNPEATPEPEPILQPEPYVASGQNTDLHSDAVDSAGDGAEHIYKEYTPQPRAQEAAPPQGAQKQERTETTENNTSTDAGTAEKAQATRAEGISEDIAQDEATAETAASGATPPQMEMFKMRRAVLPDTADTLENEEDCAPTALCAIAGGGDEQYAANAYCTLTTDVAGQGIAAEFAAQRGITEAGGSYELTRDMLRELVVQLESGGARCELSLDIDMCGDVVYVTIDVQ